MKNSFRKVMFLFVLLAGSGIAGAQSVYKIVNSKGMDVTLSGTSTLHKWIMNAQNSSGEAKFGFNPKNAELSSISALSFSLPTLNLKSKDKKLNKNAYKALKSTEHKNISYKMGTAKVMPENDGKYLVKTNGDLSIAGVTKNVDIDVYCVVNKDATITCTGSETLKMTDYDVKPPSFMAGAMKTGDDVTLNFTLLYKK